MSPAMVKLEPLRPATTQAVFFDEFESHHIDDVKEVILTISAQLLEVEKRFSLWKLPTTDSLDVSLRTIYDRLNQGYLSPLRLGKGSYCSPPSRATRARADADLEKFLINGKRPRTLKKPMARPLEDFEDLYYACCCTIKRHDEEISLRVLSGFNAVNEPMYYGGITIYQFHDTISQYWDELNHPGLVQAMDDAIRRARIKEIHLDILTQVNAHDIPTFYADELVYELYKSPGWTQGVSWLATWAPCMMYAWLAEKYRTVMKAEEAEIKMSEKAERAASAAATAEVKKQRIADLLTMEADRREWSMEIEKKEREKERARAEELKRDFIREADRIQEQGRLMKAEARTWRPVDMWWTGEMWVVDDSIDCWTDCDD